MMDSEHWQYRSGIFILWWKTITELFTSGWPLLTITGEGAIMTKYVTRCLTTAILIAVVVVTPLMAQQSETLTISTPAGSAARVTGRFSLVDDGGSHKHLEGEITNEHGDVLRLTGGYKHVTFGDGYDLATTLVADTDAETVMCLTVTSPSGEVATSIVSYNKIKQTIRPITTAGRARDLLNQSRDFATAVATVPLLASTLRAKLANQSAALQAPTPAAAAKHFTATPMEWDSTLGCIGALLVVVGAGIAVVAACLIPEPIEPLACWASVTVFMGSVMLAIDTCL